MKGHEREEDKIRNIFLNVRLQFKNPKKKSLYSEILDLGKYRKIEFLFPASQVYIRRDRNFKHGVLVNCVKLETRVLHVDHGFPPFVDER